MKKRVYRFAVLAAAAAVAGCTPESPETWYSATAGYDGRWQFGTILKDVADPDPDNVTTSPLADQLSLYLETFNTAANQPNQIWISASRTLPLSLVSATYALKAKFDLTGTPDNFSAATASVDVSAAASFQVLNATETGYTSSTGAAGLALITAEGQQRAGFCPRYLATLKEGRIIKGAATTTGGNKADSIYLRFLRHYGTEITCVSYKTGENTDGTPVYAWKIDTSVPPVVDPDMDEEWILAGHRWTGFKEDLP